MSITPISNFNLFSENITRLQDIVIPLPAFNAMVQYVEGFADFSFKRYMRQEGGSGKVDVTDKTYTFAYPFLSALYDINDIEKIDNPISRDIMRTKWQKEVYERARPFVDNCLSAEDVARFDNDPDLGIIIHVTTGYWVMFRHSCIKGLKVFHMHNHLPQFANLAKVSGDECPSVYHLYKQYMYDDRYRQAYIFDYCGVDDNNPTGDIIVATTQDYAAMPISISSKIAEHIISSVQAKKKVILTA